MKNLIRVLNGKSPTKIQISGDADEVKQEIYRLFNCGVITTLPDELADADKERIGSGEVSFVCNTYRKRFIKGLRAMAEIGMMAEFPRPKAADRKGRYEWHAIATVRAAHLHRKMFTVKTAGQEKRERKEAKGISAEQMRARVLLGIQ